MQFGPICLGIAQPTSDPPKSEDCLFVNVFAPAGATTKSKLAVWLFIQGGGYTVNSNSNWDGTEVVQTSGNNVVFVNFNYRVGMYGFLASSKIAANGNLNAGLLDQRFVMNWVKTHIAKFGGDPDNVIIHGASAGAGSVMLHLTAYGGRDDHLFTAGIFESVFLPAQPFPAQLEYQFDRVTEALNCSAAADPLTCLRGKDTATLQTANVPSAFPGRSDPPLPLFYWTPCIDGDFIQDLPYNLIAEDKFVKVPLLNGNSNNEGSYFAINATSQADISLFFQNNYPLLTANDTEAILSTYPLLDPLPDHAAWFPTASLAYGEATFICPAINIFAAYTAAPSSDPSQLWYYRYNIADTINTALGLGTPHLWESWAVLGPNNLGPATAPPGYLTYNAPIVPVVMKYFLSFVQTKNPNTLRDASAPEWSSWGGNATNTTSNRLVFELGNTHMETVEDVQTARCRFWQGLASRTQQKKKRQQQVFVA